MGPPAAVLSVARVVFDAVLVATDEFGEYCALCGRRGPNQQEFASPYAKTYAHRGCLEDHRQDLSNETTRDFEAE